ncbi:chemotaxis protein MotB [Desulfobaculum xiamenense]|uniref:Chemotaxis protein MotB n=1 Tax=Desulfobaculum xiamenense TaxID=995050 RepID=A0A846QHE7_9BACT|nr:OmpA family protein [Desulfobaculum xiamenense]NJB67698.1 chemotaxis protein MotB [Desulfobaculum xiamenense]
MPNQRDTDHPAPSQPRPADAARDVLDAPGTDGNGTSVSMRKGPPRTTAPRAEDVFAFEDDMPTFHWSVPWADLMMTMFVMFTVLFVYASAKRDFLLAFRGHVQQERVEEASQVGRHEGEVPVYEFPKTGISPSPGPHQLFEMCKATVEESGLRDVSVELEGETIRLSMHGPLLFERTQADIKPDGLRFLDMVARVIAKARYDVGVHGHTDNFPVHTERYDTNWELSTARATNVARYLIERHGVPPESVTVCGHSMYRPSAPNLSPEGKSRNRRVEIALTRPKPEEQETR